ncbi:MAG: NAD(P)H-binding protein, partial [Candidatus Limnocylindria bacterium]
MRRSSAISYLAAVKILIIGATGSIGGAALAATLDAGHEVTVVARSPDKLASVRDRVRIVEGDAGDPALIESAITGQDAVISA